MKKTLSLTLGVLAAMQLWAQPGIIATRPQDAGSDRLLTMEEAVLGYDLYPENFPTVWRPDSRALTIFDDGALHSMNPLADGNAELLSQSELQSLTGTAPVQFVKWESRDLAVFFRPDTIYLVNVASKTLQGLIQIDFNPLLDGKRAICQNEDLSAGQLHARRAKGAGTHPPPRFKP